MGYDAGKKVKGRKRHCVVDSRVEKKGEGFQKLPKRWVIERTFGWLFNFRRLLFDLEYKVRNSEGMLWFGAVQLMLDRIWPTGAS